jgi:hypothetical protein
MGNTSLPDYFTLIKQQFSLQEQLLGRHLKIDSVIGFMLTRDLFTYKTAKLQHALLVICDLNNSAIKLNQAAMDNLRDINAFLTSPETPPFTMH